MNYRPTENYAWLSPPEYADHASLPHNQRLKKYGAVQRVVNRKEMIDAIRAAITDPNRYVEGRLVAIQQELGLLDGNVADRMVEACRETYQSLINAQ
ncbi:hypothetical protein A2V71_01425 [Candidatus Berkelbacteria bacterium RBG_13_40_8]|uniref:Uncharacterized protein n=1 Tax=Candidatus Berkelbacteria bacterium RBG_13_40_8 TaxID=1797467 RepID=A0A1F5DNN6_9BACT|nr:MAG: hypothetical protein A2V71_01425 [Candidatus Berkelbacteria bacterium RBG_13_40_8]